MESIDFRSVGHGPKGRFVKIKGNSSPSVPMEINVDTTSVHASPSVEISHGLVSSLSNCSSVETDSGNLSMEEIVSMDGDGLNGFEGALDEDCGHENPSRRKGSVGIASMPNRGDVFSNMVVMNMESNSEVLLGCYNNLANENM